MLVKSTSALFQKTIMVEGTVIALLWRSDWDYIMMGVWVRFHCASGRLVFYCAGRQTINILFWREDWYFIVPEGWLKFYWAGRKAETILCWRDDWCFMLDGWLRLKYGGEADWYYIVHESWLILFCLGGLIETLLCWKGNWDNIVLERGQGLYFAGGLAEITLWWMGDRLYSSWGGTEIILCWRVWKRCKTNCLTFALQQALRIIHLHIL